ncbi:MAG: signal peptidase II [bacterium]
MISIIVACAIVIADQVTKYLVVISVPEGTRIDVLGDALRISHIKNSGAIFGVMRSSGGYFTIFSLVAAIVLVVVLLLSRRACGLVKVGLGLVLGGAIGNLIDRLRIGAVVDFVDIGAGEAVRWPSFNVADLAITVGVIFVVICSLKSKTGSMAE